MIPEDKADALIRPKDHTEEGEVICEDFLDYRADYLV